MHFLMVTEAEYFFMIVAHLHFIFLFWGLIRVYACMHVCMKVHVFSRAHLYVCACGEQGTTLCAITQSSSILSFEICPLTGIEFTKQATWTMSLGYLQICLPNTGIISITYHIVLFFTWVLRIELRSSCIHSKHFTN